MTDTADMTEQASSGAGAADEQRQGGADLLQLSDAELLVRGIPVIEIDLTGITQMTLGPNGEILSMVKNGVAITVHQSGIKQ